jgi:hypothetical protein
VDEGLEHSAQVQGGVGVTGSTELGGFALEVVLFFAAVGVVTTCTRHRHRVFPAGGERFPELSVARKALGYRLLPELVRHGPGVGDVTRLAIAVPRRTMAPGHVVVAFGAEDHPRSRNLAVRSEHRQVVALATLPFPEWSVLLRQQEGCQVRLVQPVA